MSFFLGNKGGSSIHKASTPPEDIDKYWLDTSKSPSVLKHYSSNAWVEIGNGIDDTVVSTTNTWSSDKVANMDIVGKLIEDGINVSPVMTSDTTPSPYVSSASSTYSNYYPWKASNNDGASTYWFTTNVDANGVAWWQIQLDKGYAVNKLKLTSGGSSSSGSDVFYYLKDFVLKGSNDGVTFTNLHAGTQANNADPQTYVFSNSTAYKYYRIESSNTYSSFDYRSIGDVQFYVVSEQNSNKITIKKGVESLLPLLDEAEMYLATDTNKLFIGTSSGNIHIDKSQIDDLLIGKSSTWSSDKINTMKIKGNTEKATENITPVMTSNTAPSPFVARASSVRNGNWNNEPWYAFDGSDTTYNWLAHSSSSADADFMNRNWIEIQLDASKTLKYYEITPYLTGSGDYGIKDVALYGSNDGVSYNLVGEYTHPNTGDISGHNVNNESAYKYYRFAVTSYAGAGNESVLSIRLTGVANPEPFNKITVRKGTESLLPTLSEAEIYLATDTNKVFIGTSSGNVQIGKNQVENQEILIWMGV